MKTFAILTLTLVSFLTPLLKAGDVSAERFGKLALGQKADTVLKLIGTPESKGKDVLWAATGEWVQDWKFPKKGLTLAMASNQEGGPKTLSSITAGTGCQLATQRGIQVGSPESAVRKAYAKEYEKEQSRPGQSFVAGSVYGGVIFSLNAGKVSSIFIGAAAE